MSLVLAARYETETVARERGEPKGPHKRTAYWVRAIFDASKMTQEAFAAHAKVSRGGLTKWMDGLQKPSWDTRQKLIRVAPAHLKDFDAWERTNGHAATGQTADGLKPDAPGVTGSHVQQPMGSPMRSKIARHIAWLVDLLPTDAEKSALGDLVQEFVEAHVSGSRPPP